MPKKNEKAGAVEPIVSPVRCEGMRRRGGVFSLGPVTWEQCSNNAQVTLRIKQDGKTENMPACLECWKEAQDPKWKIKIISATPIKD